MATRFDAQQTTAERSTPYREGKTTRMTESVTARIPSITYLIAAVSSMAVSAAFQISGKQKLSLFVGQWAPSFLILGLYNKLVKVGGSD